MEKNIIFSIICVSNDQAILNDWLIFGLENQTVPYELIVINNNISKYSSAAKALNMGAEKAKGRYLVFIHQDVMLLSRNWLSNLYLLILKIPQFGVIGVAGRKNIRGNITNGIHGDPPMQMGLSFKKDIAEVETVDECVIVTNADIFNKIKFDEENCNDWHLYGADYCYTCINYGLKNYVVPFPVYHKSTGKNIKSSLSKKFDDYFETLEKLLRKHSNRTLFLTSTGSWVTKIPLILQRYIYLLQHLKRTIKSKLK